MMRLRTVALLTVLFQLVAFFFSTSWTPIDHLDDTMKMQLPIRREPNDESTVKAKLAKGGITVEQWPQYHSWGPEGIDFQQVLRYINATYYDNTTWSKSARSYQPFAAYIVVDDHNAPTLWFPRATLSILKGGSAKRLSIMLPYFQRALQFQLADYSASFPSLVLALKQHGSIPLLFDLSDYRQCQDPTFEFTDERYSSSGGVPLLTLCQSPNCRYAFPIPSYGTYEYTKIGVTSEGVNQWAERMKEWAQTYPWHSKIRQAYWRGGCKEQRYNFVRIAANHSRHFSVRSVGNKCGKGPGTPAKAKTTDPPEASMQYKAVFDIDGNSWSERFPRLLCYNSVVVLLTVPNDFEEYFMKDLLPGVHFLPASMANFTEIGPMILKPENDAMLQRVVQNANAWCRAHMTPERLNLDFLSILNGYVETLDAGSPQWIYEWRRVESSYVGPHVTHDGFSKDVDVEHAQKRDSLSNPSKWKPPSYHSD
jgi:hypothetical protein